MPQPRGVSICARTFSSTLARTRSGANSRMRSSLGFFSPPMRVLAATPSGGWVQYTVHPITASPRPSAKRVSVMLGMSETIRRGGARRATATPDASTNDPITCARYFLELRRVLGQALDQLDHFLHPLAQLGGGLLRRVGPTTLERLLEVRDRDPERLQQTTRAVLGHGSLRHRRMATSPSVSRIEVRISRRALGIPGFVIGPSRGRMSGVDRAVPPVTLSQRPGCCPMYPPGEPDPWPAPLIDSIAPCTVACSRSFPSRRPRRSA